MNVANICVNIQFGNFVNFIYIHIYHIRLLAITITWSLKEINLFGLNFLPLLSSSKPCNKNSFCK